MKLKKNLEIVNGEFCNVCTFFSPLNNLCHHPKREGSKKAYPLNYCKGFVRETDKKKLYPSYWKNNG